MREKRSHESATFLTKKKQQSLVYCAQRKSMDLSMTFSTSLEFGQMMYGAIGNFFELHHTDGQKELPDLPYAPSRVLNLAATFQFDAPGHSVCHRQEVAGFRVDRHYSRRVYLRKGWCIDRKICYDSFEHRSSQDEGRRHWMRAQNGVPGTLIGHRR
jgi:hypothetical protein